MWQAFRRFRRSRPFWGGLFTILGGVEILLLPLSPIADLVLLGVAGISGALIGLLLVATGLFAWFSPPNRLMAGVFTLVFSLASFVVSNLGGLIVGMVLGLIGGALIVAWTPDKHRRGRDRRAPPPGPPAAAALLLVAMIALYLTLLPGRAAADEGPPHPPVPPPTDSGGKQLLPLSLHPPDGIVPRAPLPTLQHLVPPALLAPLQPRLSPQAKVVTSGLVGDLRMDTLTVTDFQYQGIVEYPTAGGGRQRAMHITLDSTDIGNLRISIPEKTTTARVAQAPGSRHATTTRLILDCTRLRLTLFGVLPVEFDLNFPPPPLVVIPLLYATDVKIDYVRLATPKLIIPGLRLRNEEASDGSVRRIEPSPGPHSLTPAESTTLVRMASLLKLPAMLGPYGLSDPQSRIAMVRAGPASVIRSGPLPTSTRGGPTRELPLKPENPLLDIFTHSPAELAGKQRTLDASGTR